MSAVLKVHEVAQPSHHFCAILSALLNAGNDDYDARLADVMDYVTAIENNANMTGLQASVTFAMRAKEKERTALRKQIAKLTRFENGKPEELGDWVSFYAVMEVVR